MTIRDKILDELIEWVDTPWQHQARIKPNGSFKGAVDCVGLIACVNNKFHDKCIDYTNYKRKPKGDDLLYIFKEKMIEISNDNAKYGDVAVISMGRYPHHALFLAKNNTMIHACSKQGKVVHEIFSEAYKKRVRGYFKFSWIID